MKIIDREFAIIAGLVLVLAFYLVGTSPIGTGLGVVGLLIACLYVIHRFGKQASRNTRIAGGLFMICTIWSFSQFLIDPAVPFWAGSGAELLVALVAAFWLILRPGWIPAAIILVYVFIGLIGALRSLMWILTDEHIYPTSLVFQVCAILFLRFAVIGFLLRAMAEGFGKAKSPQGDVRDVFD